MKRTTGLLAIAVALLISSCKKDDAEIVNNDPSEVTAQSDDQAFVTGETDAIANDMNDVISFSPSLTGRGAATTAYPCNATVAIDSVSNPRSITITYNGNNCAGTRSRTGVIKATIPAGVKWKDAGAVLTVAIQNLKITRLSDNKSITLNGTQVVTNVSGGLLVNLATAGTITHTISSNNMSIAFDNNTQRNWQVAKKRVFSYSNGMVITTTGTYSNGATIGISEWGTNRAGNTFTTSITQPLVVKQDCNFRITSGQVKHDRLGTTTVTFGLNAGGTATTCPGTGNYYLKIEWTGPLGNASYSQLFPY
jgi:hypothetical protein